MDYWMEIKDKENCSGYLRINSKLVPIDLIIGNRYEVYIEKPNNKKDKMNNGREVILLGFDDDFTGVPIVRYVDTGRRGRAGINTLKPIE